jgi:hypothetical protein
VLEDADAVGESEDVAEDEVGVDHATDDVSTGRSWSASVR